MPEYVRIEGLEEVMKTNVKLGKELPLAMAKSLSKTSVVVKKIDVDEMAHVFDRPTPYTMNSLYTKPATVNRMQSEVGIKEWGGKGNAAADYLRPQIYGGSRDFKRFEKALNRAGVLPSGMYVVPGSGAELDQYGNMNRGQIVKILSYFSSFGEQGYSANITEGKKTRMAKGTRKTRGLVYFVLKSKKGNLPPGIYSRTSFAWGGSVKPIMIFIKKPTYSARFDFYRISKEAANRVWKGIFDAELDYAIHQCR